MLEAVGSAAARSLVLALAVQLCLLGLRIRHPQLQRAAWVTVLAASLAMPVLQGVITIAAPHWIGGTPATLAPMDASNEPAAWLAGGAQAGAPGLMRVQSFPWEGWLAVAYLAVAGAIMLRVLVGLLLCWRLARNARPCAAAGSRVRISRHVRGPVTLGLAVILPADFETWPEPTRRAVLAHERAHVASGDFFVLLLSHLNRALFWFSPLSWWLHHRIAMLAELASDDVAIEQVGDRAAYAEILLHMARRAEPSACGMAMARIASVPQRIERILAGYRPGRVTRRGRIATIAAVLPVAIACGVSLAGAAPPDGRAIAEQREPHTAITIDPALLDKYAGFYQDPRTRSLMIVTHEGDHLMTRRAGNPAVAEFPYSERDFFFTVVPQQNSFVADDAGRIIGVVHHQDGRDVMLRRLSDEAGQQALAAVEKRIAEERAPHAEVSIDPAHLDAYVGAYQLTPRLIFTVRRDGNALYARLTGQQEYQVHPYAERDFFYTVVAAQLSFVPGPDGKASALVLHQNGQDRMANRVDPAAAAALDQRIEAERQPYRLVAIDPHLLDRYIGRYRNDTVEITASRAGNQLFVQVTGFRPYTVYPYSDSDFFATIMPAQISFTSETNGRAMQLIRHQSGMDQVLNRVE